MKANAFSDYLLTLGRSCYIAAEVQSRNGRLLVHEDQVEAVARALYDTLECARGWEHEPEVLKERLRDSVRATIKKLDEHRGIVPTRDIAPLVLAGDIRDAGEFLMNSPDVSALEIPSSQACRVALRGPELIIEAANDAFVGVAGRGDFLGLPGWEAFPELRGQGYLELLDQVFRTKKSFAGFMMPILFQPRKGAPMEEHITDFIYRPIEDGEGRVTGLFIESYDRTEWARA